MLLFEVRRDKVTELVNKVSNVLACRLKAKEQYFNFDFENSGSKKNDSRVFTTSSEIHEQNLKTAENRQPACISERLNSLRDTNSKAEGSANKGLSQAKALKTRKGSLSSYSFKWTLIKDLSPK